MWQKRLKIGTYFQIGVYVHWTFGVLLAYVAWIGLEDGLLGSVYSVLLLLGIFLCVTLHEYGHALMARRFGIETLDITLLFIGGVARLLRIPRIPWQEFLVAVAGPAVNVVIVTLLGTLLLALPMLGIPGLPQILASESPSSMAFEAINAPSVLGYMLFMMLVNTMLILFNMIPAFPMDGGRVLRSLLASVMEYRKATRLAFRIGVVCAIIMGVMAFYLNRPMIGLVAIFICYAGMSEARQVEATEPIRGLTVGDAMIPSPPSLSIDTRLGELGEIVQVGPLRAIPLVGIADVVTGMLMLEDVLQAVRSGADPNTPVGQLATHDLPILSPDESLESVVSRPPQLCRQFAVADLQGRLIGLLDLDSLRGPMEVLT